LQFRYCPHRIGEDDAGVFEYLLKLGGGRSVSVRSQKCLSTHVWRVEISEEAKPTAGYC
jgi:hypothetical protein